MNPEKNNLTASRNRRFPMNVAGVDIGSNGIRFIASKFVSRNQHTILDFHRAPVRLGHSSFSKNFIDKSAMDAALTVLKSFKNRMDRIGIDDYRAVATSAVRVSSNRNDFIRRAGKEAGIKVEIINGWEEARLTYLAVRETVNLADKKWVLVNLGGGSVEIALIDRKKLIWSETHNIGVVKIFENLSEGGKEPQDYYRMLRKYINVLSLPGKRRLSKSSGFIATGGNIEDISSIAVGREGPSGKPMTLTKEILQKIIDHLSKISYTERMEKFKLRPDRADVILPAAMVYERLADISGAKQIIVPLVGTKEGILFDIIEKTISRPDYDKAVSDELLQSSVKLGQHYKFDQAHALQVAKLALSLFDQLSSIHGLGRDDRNILLVSAVLHDIGNYISYKKHHRHSLYLISQSELPVLTETEMLMAANIARYHRKSEPSTNHEYYRALSESQRHRVSVMASILRMADALDRDHMQSVKTVKATVEKFRVALFLEVEGNSHLDLWAFEKKKGMFAGLFKMDVSIDKSPHSSSPFEGGGLRWG